MKRKTVAVIGGGASGMMAAAAAAEMGAAVTLFEKNDRVGRKILSTGNGKCNFSNRDMDARYYHCADRERLKGYLDRFGVRDAERFFRGRGMLVRERNGYLYPASEQASTVLDILRLCLVSGQVEVLTGSKVEAVYREKGKGKVAVKADGRTHFFDSAVLAAGGKAAPGTGSDGDGYRLAAALGHRINPVVPALVQLRCAGYDLKSVSGVRADARVRLLADGRTLEEERGELQITDYGISGIVVFQLSRTAAYALLHKKDVKAVVDFLPDMGGEEYRLFAAARKLTQAEQTVEEFFTGMLNKRLMTLFIRQAGLKPGQPAEEVPPQKLDGVFALCREWTIPVSGTNSFEQAQACAGGVDLREVDDNLQSLKTPGVYLAGELLDVDGRCGGYNLQWAWTSGRIAGEGAAL